MKTKLLFILLLISYSIFSQTALNFDGVNDYVSVPNGGALNNLQTGTIELWVKWNSTMQDAGASGYGSILARQNDDIGNNQVIGLSTSNPNTAKIIWKPYIYTSTVLTSTSSPMLNTWVHIAIVYSSGDHKMYINGNLEATSTETGVIANYGVPLTLGAWIDDGVSYSNSNIDEFRVWNTMRTDAEILNTYNKCLTGTENGLVMLWQFEEGTGNIVTDLSGNGYNGTLTNMDETTAWVNGYSCEPIELVAYYPFNGNANDESGNGNHGTPNGATLTTDRFGNTDSAYSFDGIDDFIQVLNSSSLDIYDSNLTLSMWLYNDNPLTDTSWKGFSKGGWDTGAGYELIFTNHPPYSGGLLGFNIGSSGYNVSSFNTYNNQWIMITGTYENGIRKVYINGIETSTSPTGSDTLESSNSDLYFGKRAPGNNYIGFVKGKMDDIRIYNSTLTETQIQSLYNNNSLGISEEEIYNDYSFFVFNNTLTISNETDVAEIKSISIYNLLAQNVFQTNNIQDKTSLHFLNQGIYILKVVNTNGNTTTKKFVIQ